VCAPVFRRGESLQSGVAGILRAASPAMAPETASTVCIVDDDAAVRSAVSLLVQSCGWEPISYAGGAEFLAAVAERWPACVLLDLQMPGMDGLTVQRELIRRGFSAPVIVTTAFSDHPSVEKALQNGALRVISKPFRPRELIDAIASVVNPLK